MTHRRAEHIRNGYVIVLAMVAAGLTTLVVWSLLTAEKDAETCASRIGNINTSNEGREEQRDAWLDDGRSWLQAAVARGAASDSVVDQTAATQYGITAANNFVRAATQEFLVPPDCSTTPDYIPGL